MLYFIVLILFSDTGGRFGSFEEGCLSEAVWCESASAQSDYKFRHDLRDRLREHRSRRTGWKTKLLDVGVILCTGRWTARSAQVQGGVSMSAWPWFEHDRLSDCHSCNLFCDNERMTNLWPLLSVLFLRLLKTTKLSSLWQSSVTSTYACWRPANMLVRLVSLDSGSQLPFYAPINRE